MGNPTTTYPPAEAQIISLFSALNNALANANSVMLSVHVNPDGDALGSLIACREIIRLAYPNITTVHGVIDGPAASYLNGLPGYDKVMDIQTASDTLLSNYDVAIACDSGSIDRLGACQDLFAAAGTSINLDHHKSNTRFADINVVLTDAAASGSVVALWAESLNIDIAKNPDLANAIYTTIVTDTGGFRFSNTQPYTHRLANECLKAGIPHVSIYRQIYERRPIAQWHLLSDALLNAEFSADKRVAWTVVTTKQKAHWGATDEHTEGIVDALRQMHEVRIAALIKENGDGGVKVSLRSEEAQMDVGAIATQLGGGGHTMAAGCTLVNTSPQAAIELLIPQLKALLS